MNHYTDVGDQACGHVQNTMYNTIINICLNNVLLDLPLGTVFDSMFEFWMDYGQYFISIETDSQTKYFFKRVVFQQWYMFVVIGTLSKH